MHKGNLDFVNGKLAAQVSFQKLWQRVPLSPTPQE